MKLDKQMKFDTSMVEIKKVNSNLAKVKIRVMYAGKNRNKTYFDKDMIINEMLPTIYNTPIVGYMENKEFTDHGDRIDIDEDGNIEFKTITYAIGLIPESTEITWEKHIEADGINEHEYLCVTGYIWKRFENECNKILNDSTKHSMEINVDEMEWSNKLDSFIIKKAEFAGFCAIGVEPCFEGSKIGGVHSYSKNELALDFSLLKEEINKLLNKEQKINSKEVFELDKEKLNDSFEEDKSTENDEEFEEIKDDNINDKNFNDEKENQENVDEEEFEQSEKQDDENFDENENKDEDYEEKYNSLKLEFDSLTEQFNTLKVENETLVEFKQEKVREEKKAKVSEFSEKLTEEELSVVYENIDNLTIEEIEIKCFALYGMKKNDVDVTDKKNTKQIFTNKFTVDKKTQSWFEGFVD